MVFIPAATESLPAMPSDTSRPLRAIRIWLLAVAALVAAIVLVGGATRLTESGLSIVEWKPLTGAVPPLTEAAWQAEFDKYKTIPQYQALNSRMTLHEFKTIYWWEWGHRLLGRLIGAVFLLPFVFFLWRGWVAPGLRWRLWSILGLGAVQGAVGWWMVSSGLAERTSVSQYRLAFHLTLACVIFAATIWTWRRLLPEPEVEADGRIRTTAFLLVGLVLVQIYLGALVAGLDAGLVYNTWPHIDGAWVPATDRLFFLAPAWRNFFENDLMVQFVHRLTAYALWIVAVLHALDAWRRLRGGPVVMAAATIALAVTLQAAVGIATLLYQVPISLALTHQGIAVLILLLVVMHAERITHGRDLRRPLADALPASR